MSYVIETCNYFTVTRRTSAEKVVSDRQPITTLCLTLLHNTLRASANAEAHVVSRDKDIALRLADDLRKHFQHFVCLYL